ncbi:unnamed protein product, partial [Brachionus calyciflorus]
HAIFVIKETIANYLDKNTDLTLASAAEKALDKLMRDRLFLKLIGKLTPRFWLILKLYYDSSTGCVSINEFNLKSYNGIENTLNPPNLKKNNLPVVFDEDFFDTLYRIHSIQRGHCGMNKLEDYVVETFYCIPGVVIEKFVKTCPVCQLKTTQCTQPRIKPIRSNKVFQRFQIDLVDMRNKALEKKGRTYRWIAHVVDHFRKFHILWALENKTADGVERHVLAYFGLPIIWQSDNGLEFKNSIMTTLLKSWDGNFQQIQTIDNVNFNLCLTPDSETEEQSNQSPLSEPPNLLETQLRRFL